MADEPKSVERLRGAVIMRDGGGRILPGQNPNIVGGRPKGSGKKKGGTK